MIPKTKPKEVLALEALGVNGDEISWSISPDGGWLEWLESFTDESNPGRTVTMHCKKHRRWRVISGKIVSNEKTWIVGSPFEVGASLRHQCDKEIQEALMSGSAP